MKHMGRSVIRLNDKTDHGGQVIDVSSGTVVMGIEAAIEGDMTFCPKCKGRYRIMPDRSGARHEGYTYAYHNDFTACGAKLISSL